MASRRKRPTQSESSAEYGRRPRRTKRLMRRLVTLMLLIVVAVVAAPTIIAKSPLRNQLLGWAMPSGGWRIESRQASFAWFGNQALHGMLVVDPDGKQFFVAESITLDRSLLALITNLNDLGHLQVVKPEAYVVTRPDGSNVEDLLTSLGRSQSSHQKQDINQPPAASPIFRVEIVDGVVRGFDTQSQQYWMLHQANLVADRQTEGGLNLNGAAQLGIGQGGNSTETKGNAGRLQFRLKQIDEGQQQLDLLAEQMPLAPLQPWLERFLTGCRITGTASTDAQIRWSVDPQQGTTVQTTGRFEASQLSLTADLLHGDRLRCDQLTMPWKLSTSGDLITMEQLSFDTDWARIRAAGSLTLDELTSLSILNLPKRKTTVAGNVNLARLATMLPQTLQLRSGVRIDSGQMKFQANGQPDNDGLGWLVSAVIENVVGTDGKHPIRWQQPVEATVEFREASQGLRVKQMSLNAPFARAQLKTAQGQINGQFQLDLEKLAQELGQFVDLGAWKFRGQGEGSLVLKHESSEKFQSQAKINLRDLHVTQEEQLIWAEPQLEVDLDLAGWAVDFAPRQIASSSIRIRGTNDELNLELLEPVDLPLADQPWKLQMDGQGPLNAWLGRLRPWLSTLPDELEGNADLKAKVRVAPDFVHLIESQVNVAQLRGRHGSLIVDEPRLELSGDCRWDAKTKSIITRELQLVSSSLALRSRDVQFNFASSESLAATGSVAFRANLERLASTAGIAGQQGSTWPRGTAMGQFQLASDAKRLQADFTINAEQLQLLRTSTGSGAAYGQPEIVWTEPQLQTSGKAIYTIADDRVELNNLQLNGQTMRLQAAVSLDKLQTDASLQTSGVVEYDSAALARLVNTYFGPEVNLRGDRQVRFQVAGRLSDPKSTGRSVHWSQHWQATADAGWSAASVYGLAMGAGKLQGTLQNGQLQIAPLDVVVGQGRLTASPRAVLAPGPEQLILPKGPLLANVQISPQVSETILKYVAPVVAGATRSEGQFSVDLEGVQVPLANPQQVRTAGRLSIHSLRVSPGPMVAELVTLVKQIEALAKRKQFLQAATSASSTDALTIKDQQIDFQVEKGRIYHRNLEFLVDDVPVRSHGSVGFDQTLALVFEIPIQNKWIEREKVLRSLAGQSLQIPIGGTFQRPRIDQRAVVNLSRQMLEGAASQAIGDELNRQLDKLFKSR